ncbi:hypothetical protein EG028_16600 [Chitinophaga barathri]|uniref:Uncharacterized protein n=1 Tax=Chitinophaga barathri TaxID=1647451 RepID=A0A3N4MA85_9BACT|nr:hypothetical protein EG028_16600 [Chitinophaga barathri]
MAGSGWMAGRTIAAAYVRHTSGLVCIPVIRKFTWHLLPGENMLSRSSKTSQYNNTSAPAIRQELPFPANYMMTPG